MPDTDSRLTRIGVFYDGNYFAHVSNHYLYSHERQARISIGGLHNFIRAEVARAEGADARFCNIVDAHYFRGRLSATEAQERDKLFAERAFDDVLMREGVVTHYLPITPTGEKGIDVWLALEVLELSFYKRFNVSVLITGDRDFVPLVRKLNTIGTRVMLLGWSLESETDGIRHHTETSQYLMDQVTYPVLMSDVIDDRTRRKDPLIDGLFLPRRDSQGLSGTERVAPVGRVVPPTSAQASTTESGREPVARGTIVALKEGYGFVRPDGEFNNLFFFHTDVLGAEFAMLTVGDSVQFVRGTNEKGPCAKSVAVLARIEATESNPDTPGESQA